MKKINLSEKTREYITAFALVLLALSSVVCFISWEVFYLLQFPGWILIMVVPLCTKSDTNSGVVQFKEIKMTSGKRYLIIAFAVLLEVVAYVLFAFKKIGVPAVIMAFVLATATIMYVKLAKKPENSASN